MARFIDRVRLQVRGGDGGRGCVAFRREKYVPRGGPSGGDGGQGGDVVLVGNRQLGTLLDFTYRRLFRAPDGSPGKGANRRGADGADLRLDVPLGTEVRTQEGMWIGEILADGEELVVAHGGQGGRGNASFRTATNRAPRMAQPGTPGEDRRIALELKLIADVGLVGAPNAGKSTLLAALSAATPEIADYPFTTKSPVLGVVRAGDERSFVVADIPGLLEGAHRGRGLGLDFLRHIERTRVLLYVLDVAAGDAAGQYEQLRYELSHHEIRLDTRPHLVVLNKMDLIDADQVQPERQALPAHEELIVVSGLQRRGLGDLVQRVAALLASLPEARARDEHDPANLPES